MFLDAFFLQILEHFSSTPTPLPPLVLGHWSKVRGERSFPPESRGEGRG